MHEGIDHPVMTPTLTDIFATEWTRLVAILVRDFRDLGIAEDAAQDAFVEATTRWPHEESPKHPGAWLLTTARRKAIDRLRRAQRLDALLPLVSIDAADRAFDASADVEQHDDALDEQLALLAGCCHPALSMEAQVALTLRIVAGLSTRQVARAFFVSESAMTRRLSRAKDKIRLAGIPFDPPDIGTLDARLPAVCAVIHSIFTEGHAGVASNELIRGDLCDEAIWLGELLGRLVPDDPEVCGLLALMLLIDARRAARVDVDGVPVVLAEQDRSRWDQQRIRRGLACLARAHAAGQGGLYQLQAAVAALHATATSVESTHWRSIVRLYDAMLRRSPTALLALNRAVAVAEASGNEAGLNALEQIHDADDLQGDLRDYPYFHSARGELLYRLGRPEAAAAALRKAKALSTNNAERRHLERRLAAL